MTKQNQDNFSLISTKHKIPWETHISKTKTTQNLQNKHTNKKPPTKRNTFTTVYHILEGDQSWCGGFVQTGCTIAVGPTSEDACEHAELAGHHYPSSKETSPWPPAQHNLCGFTAPLHWHYDLLLVEGATLLPSLAPTHSWASSSAATDPTRQPLGSSPASGATRMGLLGSPNISERQIWNASKHTHSVVYHASIQTEFTEFTEWLDGRDLQDHQVLN